jgi:transposase
MRQIHRASEKLFADYAGPTMPIIDAITGEIRPASIFVAVLGASSYTFACATPGQMQADWLTGLCRALAYIGGVTELIVPDNPRALIAEASRYEPQPNRATAEFAAHYGTVILPARPRRPQDKPHVDGTYATNPEAASPAGHGRRVRGAADEYRRREPVVRRALRHAGRPRADLAG